ncbi:MAG: SRPBCC family protein [Actinobacteria bacterium]|nr:SRPBCC family protein [Actinomycetota bacterium]
MTEPDVVESIEIAAPAALVYGLLTDVARMGEWSPEATGARSTVVDRLPRVGDTFTGTNRRGVVTWSTQCTVTIADEPHVFQFTVERRPLRLSTWTYELRTIETGTLVTEMWSDNRDGLVGLAIKALGQFVIPGSRPDHNRRNMKATLAALKKTAERAAPQAE